MCALGPIASGGTGTLIVTLRPSGAGTLSITATASSQSTYDPNVANNSATATTTVTPRPACADGVDNDGDGRVDYLADPGCLSASDSTEGTDADSADILYSAAVSESSIALGDSVTYALTVTNAGPDPSESVAVSLQFLTDGYATLSLASITLTQGSCADAGGGVTTCALGTIAAGSSATVTIVVRLGEPPSGSPPQRPSRLTLQSGVQSATPDPNPLNNFVERTIAVTAPLVAFSIGGRPDPVSLVIPAERRKK